MVSPVGAPPNCCAHDLFHFSGSKPAPSLQSPSGLLTLLFPPGAPLPPVPLPRHSSVCLSFTAGFSRPVYTRCFPSSPPISLPTHCFLIRSSPSNGSRSGKDFSLAPPLARLQPGWTQGHKHASPLLLFHGFMALAPFCSHIAGFTDTTVLTFPGNFHSQPSQFPKPASYQQAAGRAV